MTRGIRLTSVLALLALLVGTAAASADARNDAGAAPRWQLVWQDEFDSHELDSARWDTCYWWAVQAGERGCTISTNDELQWYVPEQVRVAGGTMRLVAERRSENGFPYVSGVVSSYGHFSFAYGFVEARIRAARGRGLWSALWLLPESERWPPEIDILEVRGDWPRRIMHNVHFGTSAEPADQSRWSRGADTTRGWHVLGVHWAPGKLVWYRDGVQTHVVTTNVPAEPMHVIAGLAVGGHFPGSPGPDTVFPARFEIDYVRVWQDGSVGRSSSSISPAALSACVSAGGGGCHEQLPIPEHLRRDTRR